MAETEHKTAEDFSRKMKFFFIKLDFSQRSLESEIDKILNSKVIIFGGKWHFTLRNQAALEAYIGETLCRLYNGSWAGEFDSTSPTSNYYYSYIEFGSYILYPSHFLSHRISNGEKSEGTFRNYIEKIIPKIQARKSVT